MGSQRTDGESGRTDPIRVVIADDDPFARRMVKETLQAAGIVVIAEATNGREALELTKHYRPDLVLLDVVMPEMDGVTATRRICEAVPGQRVVLLTGAPDEDLGLLGLRAGASGYLSKQVDVASLPRALEAALQGEVAVSRRLTTRLVEHIRSLPETTPGVRPVKSPLTSREWEVLDLVAQRMTNEEIARQLVLSPETVRSHLKNIFRKLEISSRDEAVRAAERIRSGGDF
jgi:NarL family two-component system response regulator LiaR